MIQSVFGHRNIVTCIAYSPRFGLPGSFSSVTGDGVVATGSLDASVLIWHWSARVQRIVGYEEDGWCCYIITEVWFVRLFVFTCRCGCQSSIYSNWA